MLLADQAVDPLAPSILSLIFSSIVVPVVAGLAWFIKKLYSRIETLEDKNQRLADNNSVLTGKLMAAEMRLSLKGKENAEQIDAIKEATGTSESVDKIVQDKRAKNGGPP